MRTNIQDHFSDLKSRSGLEQRIQAFLVDKFPSLKPSSLVPGSEIHKDLRSICMDKARVLDPRRFCLLNRLSRSDIAF